MEPLSQRSAMMLDIIRDLRNVQERLGVLEDHFEDDGLIMRLAETAHLLAVKLEAIEQKINARELGNADR